MEIISIGYLLKEREYVSEQIYSYERVKSQFCSKKLRFNQSPFGSNTVSVREQFMIIDSLITEVSEQPITKNFNAQNMTRSTISMGLQLTELCAL
jgi:hypothetical protein